MVNRICFIVNSSIQYPYISNLLEANFLQGIEISLICNNKNNLTNKFNNFMASIITNFENKNASSIKPLTKKKLTTTACQLDCSAHFDTLFIDLAYTKLNYASENGNNLITLKLNKKYPAYIDKLAWIKEGQTIELKCVLNNKVDILTYTTSNNNELLTQRVKNLNAVFYDILYYAIKKIIQK